ncbi:hypothetical protein CRE_23284 [Caenorhabditis remanei]|uniref:Uncharacterized protein n=1 Tax=Caenorhabditis remanei TaxID=31234 RepID=E3NVJ1_CAERE|nr:hypothetical protein CRE_23284 [Caenorhabditis remanei]
MAQAEPAPEPKLIFSLFTHFYTLFFHFFYFFSFPLFHTETKLDLGCTRESLGAMKDRKFFQNLRRHERQKILLKTQAP